MDKQKPVTEEVKNWSIDFMKSVETEGYESMVGKLNQLTPELRVGVLDFLKTVTEYCVKNDLNDHLEGVNTYKDLIRRDNIPMKINGHRCSKLQRKLLGKGKVYERWGNPRGRN